MKVYVAGAYSNNDVGQNVHNAIEVADRLLESGFIPYLPHLTHLWHLVSPKDARVWMNIDKEFLKVCDCVFRMYGLSKGADEEVALAKELGIPVYYKMYDLLEAQDG